MADEENTDSAQPEEAPAPEVQETDIDPEMEAAIESLISDVEGEVSPNPEPDFKITRGDEDGEETKSETPPPDDKPETGDGDTEPVGTEDGTPDVPDSEPEVPDVSPEQTAEPASQLTDPGDFVPGDYSFEVKTQDGKTHKISNLEEAEAFAETLDEAPENISAKDFMRFNRQSTRMAMGLEQDRAKYDADKAQYEEQSAITQAAESNLLSISTGLDYLTKKGIIPPVAKRYDTPEMGNKWGSDELKDQPGIKERLELLSYMAKENDVRTAAGLPPSFDILAAHTAMELESVKKQSADETKAEDTARKAKASKIGGNAPYIQTSERPGIIAGEGGTLDDLTIEAWNF